MYGSERAAVFGRAATRLAVLVQPHREDAPLPLAESALPLVQELCGATGVAGSEPSLVAAALAALLRLAERHADRELRLASVAGVVTIFRIAHSPDLLAMFVPGVSTALLRVALGDFKQGKALTAAAIDAWALVVCSVLEDSIPLATATVQTTAAAATAVSPPSMPPAVVRDAEWLRLTAGRVEIMAERLFSVRYGPQLVDQWQVRRALVNAAKMLLDRCSASLRACVPLLVDCCVMHLDDEFEEVASVADDAIKSFAARSDQAMTDSCSLAEASAKLAELAQRASVAAADIQTPLAILEARLVDLLSSLLRLYRLASFNDEKVCLFLSYTYNTCIPTTISLSLSACTASQSDQNDKWLH